MDATPKIARPLNAQRIRRRRPLGVLVLALIALGVIIGLGVSRPEPAQAKSSYLAAFRVQYPAVSGAKLDSCATCHTGNIPDLNPFGADYLRLGHNFAAIEALDSDQDGANNRAEIGALTWPGDASDKPGAAPTATSVAPTATSVAPTATSVAPPAIATTVAPPPVGDGKYVLIGWNDLGMHCMNESFANMVVLPPWNTLWAQLIRQGPEPEIITDGVVIEYSIIDNTYSAGKTDFWDYAEDLFGVTLAPNVGLSGATLAGKMHAAGDHFVIEGIPLTPYLDSAPEPIPANWYPYQLAHMVAKDSVTGEVLAETTTVAPVSTEMRCDTCHFDGGQEGIATGNVETNILVLHDKEEGTRLMDSRPVLCADCHAANALGMPGVPGLPSLSRAMHSKHAPEGGDGDGASALGKAITVTRDDSIIQTLLNPSQPLVTITDEGTDNCYLCHPGVQTQCLRGTMADGGMTCISCHGGTADVADENREPWVDEPRCGSCHGPEYAENPGTLYRNSVGHGGLYCEACHGTPHAILPSMEPNDNIQNIALQGHAGTLSDCTVCHVQTPAGPGPHGMRVQVPPTATAEPTAAPTDEPAPTTQPTATDQPTATAEPTATPRPTEDAGERREVELKGEIQTRPAATRVGAWQIAGREVQVEASTRFDESDGPAVLGARVELKGFQEPGGRIVAAKIKVQSDGSEAEKVKFAGAIQSLPQDSLLGAWRVADRTVVVDQATNLDGRTNRFSLDRRVTVRGWQLDDGSVLATEIKLREED